MTNNPSQHQPDGDGLRSTIYNILNEEITQPRPEYLPAHFNNAVTRLTALFSAPPQPAPDAVAIRKAVKAGVTFALSDGEWIGRHNLPSQEELDLIAKCILQRTDAILAAIAAPVPSPDGAADLLSLVTEIICRFQNDERALYPDNEVLIALDQIRCAIGSPSPAVAAEPDDRKKIIALAGRIDAAHFIKLIGMDQDVDADEREFIVEALQRYAIPPVRGDRELLERCAKIAEPWAGFWLDDNSTDVDRAVVAVRTEIAEKIRALPVQSAPDRDTLYAILSKHIPQDMIDGIWQELVEAGQTGAGERGRISFPRWWIQKLRDGLFEMALPSGPLGDWAFLFREQLNDKLAKSARLTAARNESK